MRLQHGQSITEFAVGAAAMTLLLLGSITIAGYQEVQRRAAIAARQEAFEAAWIGTRANRDDTLRRVAVSHLDAPGLVDAVGRGKYLRPDDISASASLQQSPGLAGNAAHLMIDPLQMAGGFLGADFDLAVDGLVAGAINVNLAPLPHLPPPFADLSLELRQPFALMADAWNAAGANHVVRRTSGLVPATGLAGLQSIWRPLLAPLALLEPSLAQLCLGLIEADRVPEDRLGTGRTPLPGRCP